MQSIVNTIKGRAIDLAAQITPILRESKFRESGMLTPEEFVLAGDHLVATCPTWAWAKGDPSCTKSYLPEDKQFLVTKNVPCSKRCRDMEYNNESEKIIEGEGLDEGWVDTHYYAAQNAPTVNDSASKGTDDTYKNNFDAKAANFENDEDNEDDELEGVDMDDFLEKLDEDLETAHSMVKKAALVDPTVASADDGSVAGDGEEEILATRTYDLNITYDNYYRTPRLWLTGYDEKMKPLTTEQIYEDISQDFVKKTVTVENHPHIEGVPQASVHPCRHAQAMKNLIQTVEEGGGSLEVHMYLIVFLKFVQAVIPTIEYDYTANFNMS
ncbi:ubiquitin-like-conjugating enzyme ATG3 [Varroa jacobsoni]|uniref:ubiquitin-like-conjugating enzyme ATG3 n=1 Tax=Varroa jacobsoni TaxID=62625 RepID=UPI000BF82518|nr:ubiquitin-like-conjugating enzyme ATG3 [Varroa jacobsoni]XP_022693307.1 ubiquitin-like-conjugating enzyme ATG3 [Varroa jacobsoni]